MALKDIPMTGTQQKELEMLLLKGTISGNLPFTWIDNDFIQAAFALARPSAKLPNRRPVSGPLPAVTARSHFWTMTQSAAIRH